MLVTVCLVILCPLLSWVVYWYARIRYFESYLKTIPGPKPIPLVGNALELGSTTTVLPKLMHFYDTYKTNFKLYLGSQAGVFITEPKDIEFFLSSTTILTKSDSYKFAHKWLGAGLLTSTGSRWKKHRKVITPAFHFQILEEFIDVFNAQGDVLISKLDKESAKGNFDLFPFIARCTLDVICETAMGMSVNAQDDYNSEYVKSVNLLLEVIIKRTFSATLGNKFIYPFTRMYKEEKHALKVVQDYTKSVIASRKKEFFNSGKSWEETTDSFGRKKKRAFLDLLLDYSTRDPDFTEEDMRQEVDTFMFAGHDTTATSITFALHALATHPEIQEKAYEEIRNIFGDDPQRKATYKDLQEMKYLEMVIKESLRIYVTVPMVGRLLEEDIKFNGITLPKGAIISLFIYAVEHSPKTYKNPEEFDPERFSPENAKSRHSFAYIPFSAGPRNCIGQKYAMLEMKATISNVLRNFELLPPVPPHKIVLKNAVVLKSDNGVFVTLRRRQK